MVGCKGPIKLVVKGVIPHEAPVLMITGHCAAFATVYPLSDDGYTWDDGHDHEEACCFPRLGTDVGLLLLLSNKIWEICEGLKEVTNLSRISSDKYAGVGKYEFDICLTNEAGCPLEAGVLSLLGRQQSKQDCRTSRGVTSSVGSYLGSNFLQWCRCKLVSTSLLHDKLCTRRADHDNDT
eukprot:3268407-Ditylum_brightwellii.AAC.1